MEAYDEDPDAEFDAMTNDFGVDEDEGDDGIESDDEAELFDSVCAFCDDGGKLLCCEGRCIRSFHPTVDAGEDSDCDDLGLSITKVEAMQTFLCLNCKHKIHQCFACGQLGSSDKVSGAEVFNCISATCGHFYHPECAAKLLHPMDEAKANEVRKSISEGESFTCPVHKCFVCRKGEDKDTPGLQFAVCRRCPKTYHRECLPRKIVFEDSEEEGILKRAWEGLLPNNRVLIYCLKHKIDENLGRPLKSRIQFPDLEEKEKKRRLELLVAKKSAARERRYVDTGDFFTQRSVKVPKHVSFYDAKCSGSMMEMKVPFPKKDPYISEKPKTSDAFRKPVDKLKIYKSSPVDNHRVLLGEEGFTKTTAAPRKREPPSQVDEKTKKRIMDMIKENESVITVDDIRKSHKVPSIYANSHYSKVMVDKTITLGKVEGFIKAVQTSLKKLEQGGTVEDARAVCGPEILNTIVKWKRKLSVYLAPFLHANRYSSYGRHFTKVDKLKEIVDMLHWYVRNGDTIVDFCCGSNDFSWLMKNKLEETGKQCNFKNFDIIQPKNDFCFEKRDWMEVGIDELPDGRNLIMGLNPPFGVKASLANTFIDQALKFKPKLIILIVPPETRRLDRKRPYDLIWDDTEKLSGRSFYLPGSVNVNDNQMDQWNTIAPVLYLWSRSDWTKMHRNIARNRGHLPMDTDGGSGGGGSESGGVQCYKRRATPKQSRYGGGYGGGDGGGGGGDEDGGFEDQLPPPPPLEYRFDPLEPPPLPPPPTGEQKDYAGGGGDEDGGFGEELPEYRFDSLELPPPPPLPPPHCSLSGNNDGGLGNLFLPPPQEDYGGGGVQCYSRRAAPKQSRYGGGGGGGGDEDSGFDHQLPPPPPPPRIPPYVYNNLPSPTPESSYEYQQRRLPSPTPESSLSYNRVVVDSTTTMPYQPRFYNFGPTAATSTTTMFPPPPPRPPLSSFDANNMFSFTPGFPNPSLHHRNSF